MGSSHRDGENTTYSSNDGLDNLVPFSEIQKSSYRSSDRCGQLSSGAMAHQPTVLQCAMRRKATGTDSLANTPLKAAQVPLATAYTIHKFSEVMMGILEKEFRSADA